jgi:hypothetical protein
MIGYMSDGLKTVADFAKGFADMPKPVQQIGLAFGAFLVAAPLVVTAVGTIITNFGVIAGAAGTIGTAIAGFATTIATYGAATSAAVGLMAGAWVAGAAVAVYSIGTLTSAFYQLYAAQSKLDTSTNSLAFSIEKLLDRVRKQHPEVGALELQYRAGKLSAEDFSAELRRLASGMESTTVQGTASKPVIKGLGEEHGKAAEAVTKHAKAMEMAKLPSADLLALFERMKDAAQQKQEQIGKLADIMDRYGVVTADAALKAARSLDILFQSYRQLSDAPDLGGIGIEFSKLPKAPDAGLPGPGGFEEFRRSGRNIGPEGMLTREQADAIKERYKQVGAAGKAAMRQVSTVVTDLSRSLSDLAWEGGKFGDIMVGVGKAVGKSITRDLIEGALTPLKNKLLDVGVIFGKVFGGGTGVIKSAVPGVTAVGLENGGLGNLPGLGGSATKGVSSGIGGIAGAVNMVTGIASAISGIFGNFQMAGINKTLDLIEHEARYSQIHLLNTLNKANEYWPYMKNCWESLIRMEQRGMNVAGGGAVQNNFAGAYFLTDSAFEDFMQKQARWLKAQGL